MIMDWKTEQSLIRLAKGERLIQTVSQRALLNSFIQDHPD